MSIDQKIEPGVLRIFRIFIGLRAAVVANSILFLAIISEWKIDAGVLPIIGFVIIDSFLLFLYLVIPKIFTILKRWYLPIALIWATIGPMAQMYIGFVLADTTPIQQSMFFMTPLPFLVIFIPFIIIAWQYPWKYVLRFCIAILFIDAVFVIQVYARSPENALIVLGISIIRTMIFLLVGKMITNLVSVQREQRARLTEANENLTHLAATLEQLTVSRERNRMARELHDILAHTLSGIAVEVEGARAILDINPAETAVLLDQSLFAIRQGLFETRRALQSLRSSPLEDLGLGLSIKNLVENIPNQKHLNVHMNVDDRIQGFSADVEQCFYRVAQEGISNIVSHSQAKDISVELVLEDQQLILRIEDNGIGFDANEESENADTDLKFGLLGMRERADMIHAIIKIESNPGFGTKIELVYGKKNAE